jgi:meiotically up-regulated gene 157 (Mug157) protein
MMFARYLDSASTIMAAIGGQRNLANHMHNFATSIRSAIATYGIVSDPVYGQVYAFEVDGFGSGMPSLPFLSPLFFLISIFSNFGPKVCSPLWTANRMDDANIPSLLSAPFIGYLNVTDTIYQNTRKFILSKDNPYYMRGPVINAYVCPLSHSTYPLSIPTTADTRPQSRRPPRVLWLRVANGLHNAHLHNLLYFRNPNSTQGDRVKYGWSGIDT